jgi:glutamine phosphoribosylpyrophosphate amidotransferase
MCGIAGIVRPRASESVDEQALLRMVAAIRHRGPDGFGLALDAGAGLVSARLAIFDVPRGWQPCEAAPEGGILVYNGEVYNHPELRAGLAGRGESFTTTCDTEVVLRLLEREGVSSLDKLNGHKDKAGNYHYHATKTYPYINGGFYGVVTEREGQVDPQPRAVSPRPALPPLRDAKITKFSETT